jgi:hypothetical protein
MKSKEDPHQNKDKKEGKSSKRSHSAIQQGEPVRQHVQLSIHVKSFNVPDQNSTPTKDYTRLKKRKKKKEKEKEKEKINRLELKEKKEKIDKYLHKEVTLRIHQERMSVQTWLTLGCNCGKEGHDEEKEKIKTQIINNNNKVMNSLKDNSWSGI